MDEHIQTQVFAYGLFFRPNTFWNHTTGHVLTPSHAKAIELRQVTVQSYTQTTSLSVTYVIRIFLGMIFS